MKYNNKWLFLLSFFFFPFGFFLRVAPSFSPSFSRFPLNSFLTRCIFVSDSRRLCRCVGVSSRRDPAKRMPLPRASLTIRRGCRKIRDTRKSISTAVGSDGVSRKSHCIGAPARGRRRMTDVLSSAPRESRTSRGHRAIYAILLSVRISCGCGLGAKRCFMRRFAAFRQRDRAARAKLRLPTNSLIDP